MTFEEMDQAITDFIWIVKARYTLHGADDFRDWLIEGDKIGVLLERANHIKDDNFRDKFLNEEFNLLFAFWRDGQLYE